MTFIHLEKLETYKKEYRKQTGTKVHVILENEEEIDAFIVGLYDLYFNYDIDVLARLIDIMKTSIGKEDVYKTDKGGLYYFRMSKSENYYFSIILESIYGKRKNATSLVGIALTRLCVTYGKASLKLAKVSTTERSRIWNNLHNEIKLQLNREWFCRH